MSAVENASNKYCEGEEIGRRDACERVVAEFLGCGSPYPFTDLDAALLPSSEESGAWTCGERVW
jgi:hypothetical protein